MERDELMGFNLVIEILLVVTKHERAKAIFADLRFNLVIEILLVVTRPIIGRQFPLAIVSISLSRFSSL